jgi:predicted  nucleic acid-binding Zn-ribbon protein
MLNSIFLALLVAILVTMYSIRRDIKNTNDNLENIHETLGRIETFLDSAFSLMQMQERNHGEIEKTLVENTKIIKENLCQIYTQNDLFIGCYLERKKSRKKSKAV